MSLRDLAAKNVRAVLNSRAVVKRRFPDFDQATLDIIARVMPFTMTTPQRVAAVRQAVQYVEANDIPGAFVECGVWKGGSSMAAALSFKTPRPFYLFDTFEGMTAPTAEDVRASDGRGADAVLGAADKGAHVWCESGLAEVQANMRSTGYPEGLVTCVKGMVEDTIPANAPDQIAILRLDTDWYASTRHELEHLYPRLSPGGVLIIDDYGYWEGARKAVDEYFAGRVLLHRIDDTGRMTIKAVG